MVFYAYVLTRLFTFNKELRIEGDEARHLKTARTFYKMWNNDWYDFHPPLYSLLIRVSSLLLPDYLAGILVSFLSSIGLFWVSSELYPRLGLTFTQTQVALWFLTFNYTLIYFSQRVFRYQLFAFLWTWAFLALLQHHYVLAGVLWGLVTLTCAVNGLRFAYVLAVMALFEPKMAFLATLFIGTGIYALFWIMPKMWLYTQKKYHPSGAEGKLDIVNPFTFRQLLTPMYFPLNYAYYGKRYLKYSLNGLIGRLMGVWGLYPVHKAVYILFYLLLGVTVVGCLKPSLMVAELLCLTVILLTPSLEVKYRPRNSIMAIPLVAYFFARGATCLYQYFALKTNW